MKRLAIACTSGLLCVAVLPPSTTAQAPEALAGLAVDATIGSAARTIRDNANAVIQQLEQSVGISSFRARQDLAYLIAETDYVASKQQGELFRNLDRQERQLFVDANNLILKARREADGSVKGVQTVAETLESGLGRLPFADKSPRVQRSYPAYLVSQTEGGTVQVEARGSLLGVGESGLKIGNDRCAPVGKTETALTFACPGGPFASDGRPKTVSADLSLTVPRGFMDQLLFRPARTKTYRLMTVVMPPRLGQFTVEGGYETTVRETQPRTGDIRAQNNHCQRERTHGPFRFSTTPGWSIDPASIALGGVHSSNRGVTVLGPDEVATSGFYYTLKLANGGRCFMGAMDARASRHQDVTWTEYRDVPREAALALPGGDLSWGTDAAIAVPDGLKWFRITVAQMDGQSRVITDRSEANDWFSVDHDAARRTIVIRPRSLTEAMTAR